MYHFVSCRTQDDVLGVFLAIIFDDGAAELWYDELYLNISNTHIYQIQGEERPFLSHQSEQQADL